MKKQKILMFGVSALVTAGMLCSCTPEGEGNPPVATAQNQSATAAATELVADIPSAKYFLTEPVPTEVVDKILQAGIHAPSARNLQPWHFTVVNDSEILQKISDDMSAGMPGGAQPPAEEASERAKSKKAGLTDSPLAIVISSVAGSEFDAGLACQNMSVEANLLGYGTKIISSPTIALNGENQEEYKILLGIPEDQAAVAVLLIGKTDTETAEGIDAISKATTRNPKTDMVTTVGE